MPLGILTDEQFEAELAQIDKSKNGNGKVITIEKGRGEKLNTPESARNLISELAISGGDVNEIAREFNISPSSISAYKHGSTSTASYNNPTEALTRNNNSVRDRIIRKSRKKLILAIDSITEEKIADISVREAAAVAKDMSSIIRNMEPEIKPEVNVNSQFVFFAPQVRKEVDYPIIDVSD